MNTNDRKNCIQAYLSAPTPAKASGGAFSLASILPTIVVFLLFLTLGICGALTEGYEKTDWWAYASFTVTPVAFGIVAYVFLRYQKTSVKTAIYAQKCSPKYFFWAIILQIGLFALSQLNGAFLTWLKRFGYQAEDIVLPSLDGFGIVGVLFAVAVLPAVMEEIVFRGALLYGLKKNFPVWLATLICGGMFAIYHQRPEQTMYQFVCGTAYALLAIRAGSVLPTILAHFLNNATIIILQANGINSFTLPVFIAIVAVSSVCLLASMGYLIFIDKNKPKRSTPTQIKDFFLFASIGLFIVSFSWLTTLFMGF